MMYCNAPLEKHFKIQEELLKTTRGTREMLQSLVWEGMDDVIFNTLARFADPEISSALNIFDCNAKGATLAMHSTIAQSMWK